MLLRAPKLKQDIITFPNYPAEIMALKELPDGSETIIYKFTVTVDVDAVIENNSYNLVAKVYKEKPKPKVIKRKVSSSKKWRKRTKRAERNVRRAVKAEKEKVLVQANVDLTRYISNDLTNVSRGSLTRRQSNSLASLSKIVKPNDPFSQNAKSSFSPRVSTVFKPTPKKSKKGLSTEVEQATIKTTTTSSKFSSAALKAKRDPASITAKTMPAFSSLLSKPLAKMASNFVFTAPTSLKRIPVVKISPRKKEVTFSIRLKRSRLVDTSSFYLNLELENKKGVKVDEESKVVPHARILNNFITPRRAPAIEAEYLKPGTISVKVRPPKDRMAKSMKVFRRLSAPTEGGTDSGSPWDIVFNSVVEGSSEVVFKDSIATSRPVLYRAVSYGENSKPSEAFSSTVVLPLAQFKREQTGSLTAVPSLTSVGSNTFCNVKVKDIPDDVVSVMLKRYDLTNVSDADRKASKGSGFLYVGKTPADQVLSVEGLGPDSTVQFTDESTKTGRTYSFVPVGVTKTGKQIVGSSAIIEIPISASRAQVLLKVTSPTIESPGTSAIEVGFEITAKFTEFGFSEIKRVLESSGQKSLFDNNLLQDRDKFESLINILVERRNSKTGEEESLGVFQVGEFVDSPEVRREKNIKNLDPGIEYTYTFTALLESAETLFPTLKRKETDIRTLQTFSRKVSKFQNPLSLNRATLQSTQRQLDKTKPSRLEPTDPIIAGRTDVQVTREFRAPLPEGLDNSLRVEKYKRFNRVVWRMSGTEVVDHFKIYVASSGGRVLIDTVHCDDTTSEFYYRHYDKDYDTNFQYVIQPIDLSYREMDPIYARTIKPASVYKRFGLPSTTKIRRL